MLLLATTFLAASAVQAQTAPANPLSTELKGAYTRIKANLTKMADKMPEGNYDFKASPDIRTFGALMAHVADSNAGGCSGLLGERKNIGAASKTTKADLVAALKESFDICDKAFDALTDQSALEMTGQGQRQRSKLGVLYGVVVHDNEEYGYGCIYLRLKGIVPPSSEGQMGR